MDYKQRITEEAAVMFRTYGIRAVTMDMLANQMGISKRTIYEVFKDKDELLQGVLRLMKVRQHEFMKKIFSETGNVIEAIFKMLDMMRDHLQNMSPAFQMDMKRYHNEIMKKIEDKNDLPYYDTNTELIKRGIKEGIFRKDINIDLTEKCLLEVARMSNDKSVFPPDDFMNKDVIRTLYINYLRGISTQKGLDLINFYDKK
ncbi:MAG: TetR/AcrR family transcriptional regulator [Bacteroidales bacterium]|jgi:AcrR family transcriptional regulator|nr:TetR/AcrR family transcriptional regulator [Bacteroidales bacterium]